MIIMTQEFDMETETVLISDNNTTNTTPPTTTKMEDDEHEEGEILEDGEIADDDNNNNNNQQQQQPHQKGGSNENEGNNNNNNNKTFGGGGNTNNNNNNNNNNLKNQKFGFDRDDFFSGKMSRRKRRGAGGGDRGKKRRYSNSNNNNNSNDHQGSSPTKRKFLSPNNNNQNQSNNQNNNNNNNETSATPTSSSSTTTNTTVSTGGVGSGGQRELIDITQQMNDSSYDSVELSDVDEFKFDLIEFDVFMEILGCKINENEEIVQQNNIPDVDKSKLMCRIVKIMKKLHGNDPDTARRFARLKRRSKEKQNALIEAAGDEKATAAVVASVPKNVYKTPCKFYMDGKCHKGSDCLYSHDIPIPKRKELCKFYLQGFCGKGDDCLFMHNEFPCKFFHTNTKCYSGENCRFSHKPLSDEMREVLRNYLDSGTFPDEVKPYRPINHINDWLKDDDPDSQDFDYEALLNSKTRKVLLGPPTEKMKKSLETWKWQQELKEAEKAYVGLKRNLFSIDDGLALEEKPPTPRIEDDEEEIEAFIRNYYNDQLDTDEYEERLQLREMEELEMRIKAEKEQEKLKESMKLAEPMEQQQQQVLPQSFPVQPAPPAVPEMSEEEKRLIEASALDEDLRILPQPFTLPPAFQNAGLTPPQSIVAPVVDPRQQLSLAGVQPQPQVSPFGSFPSSSNLPDQSLSVEQTSLSGFNPIGTSLVPPMEVSSATNMAQMQQQQQQQQQQIISKPAITRDPRIRDPRLNSANRNNNNNNNNNNSTASTTTSSTITSSISIVKPEFKIIKSNPNLVIKYKLAAINIDPINYTLYHDLFYNDPTLKNDPRLKRFFVNPTKPTEKPTISSVNNLKTESKSEDLVKPTVATISSPPRQSTSTSSSTTNQTVKSDFGSKNIRDPRMRSRDMDHRSNSIDTKNSDSNTSITSTSSTDQNSKSDWKMENSPESKPLLNNNNNQDNNNNNNDNQNRNTNSDSNTNTTNNNTNNTNNTNKTGVDRSSIPSYALSAIAPTQSLFSSVTKNLFVNSSSSNSSTSNVSSVNSNNNNNDNKKEEVEDDDEDDEDQLKVDEGLVLNSTEDEEDTTNNDLDDNVTPKTSSSSFSWADKIKQQSLDSDNETDMEIIQEPINNNQDNSNNGINNNNNNESESECENDLIIATSSSETEDNTNSNSNSSSSNNDNNSLINQC